MAKCSVYCCELKKIKMIKAKESNNCSYSNSYISINDSDSYYPLCSDIEWDERRQPTECK